MLNWYAIVRWVHILAGAAWLGEVMMVVFVLLPALASTQPDKRRAFISNVFPKVFRLASVLAGMTLAAGLALNYMLTGGWQDLGAYLATRSGKAILAGGLLGALLASFHFFVEARIEGRVVQLLDAKDEVERARIERLLNIVPRAGLVVIILVFILMMIGARGF
jgi:uncharacterized membrane protein